MKGKKNGCGNHKKSCVDPVGCADNTCILNYYYKQEMKNKEIEKVNLTT